jgi:hypothetical protein
MSDIHFKKALSKLKIFYTEGGCDNFVNRMKVFRPLNFYATYFSRQKVQKDLTEVRFELTPPERCGPEPHALDHSAIQPQPFFLQFLS